MTPAQAAAERVEAFLTARQKSYDSRGIVAHDTILSIPGASITASDLRALVVAAGGDASVKAALRWSECHEDVARGGESQPCDKTAVALRIDPTEGNPYPVCAYHARAEMVPLTDLVARGGER